ncbi:MAG: hypothetical protein WD990_11635 [Acidimicrobiia bacterium]
MSTLDHKDALDAARRHTILQSWRSLGGTGVAWTGRERVAIVAEARRARRGDPPSGELDAAPTRAVRTIASAPWTIRGPWVESLIDAGMKMDQYVEAVGVVARAVAIDTFLRSLGLDEEQLPDPEEGVPTEAVDERARGVRAWVPMVGGASITQALSLVPSENKALEALHGALYLTYDEMSDPNPGKDLTRPQMELVAARTSAINECFY